MHAQLCWRRESRPWVEIRSGDYQICKDLATNDSFGWLHPTQQTNEEDKEQERREGIDR